MALINNATREITAKIVYYGPGLGGKTTNLKYIYDTLPQERKGKMISLATETDRTLFFDFLPIELGRIKDFKTRVQLYTVPGQVFYDATRKLVLQGVDGVVFVADSQIEMLQSNEESMENLKTNLAEKKIEIEEIPLSIQYNKRDLPNILPVDELNRRLNHWDCPYYEASAVRGDGVHETFRGICRQVLQSLSNKFVSMEREAAGATFRRFEADIEKAQDALLPETIPPDSIMAEDLELVEPDVARAATEQALAQGLDEAVQSFPLEPEPSESTLTSLQRAQIEEDFIALTDLEEIADLHEIVSEADRMEAPEPALAPAAPVIQMRAPEPSPAIGSIPVETVEAEPEPEEILRPIMPAPAHLFEEAPFPERSALDAAPPPVVKNAALSQDIVPSAIPAASPVAVPSQIASTELVVPIDLSSLGIEQMPEGLELKFTIKLIFKK